MARSGWTHIGSPGSYAGAVLDAYQNSNPVHAKLFTLTAANGQRFDYLHQRAPGEVSNNSFAAVAPSGRWFVSGEWGTMRWLLVFAMPHAPPDIPGPGLMNVS